MDKIRAFYETRKIEKRADGVEKEILTVEEVFILKFLDAINVLVARNGGYYKATPKHMEHLYVVGNQADTIGAVSTVEVMPIDSLIIVDENTAPKGVIYRQVFKEIVL